MKVFLLEDEVGFYPRNQILDILSQHEVTIAKSFDEGVDTYIPPYDLLLLDHDMRGFYDRSDYPNCGYQFCKWLVGLRHRHKPKVILHSQNHTGRMNMFDILTGNGFHVQEMAFSQEYLTFLKDQL